MGKRILVRRRGKGGTQWRAPSKGKIAPAKYPLFNPEELVTGKIVDIVHERGRSAPLSKILFKGSINYVPAVAGLTVDSDIYMGASAPLQQGSVLPLASIPEGSEICNIERRFGDGGKLVRVSGTSAILFSKTGDNSIIRFPSGKSFIISSKCRASLGKIAGGGKTEKPFLRAGPRYYAKIAKNQQYPRVRGIAMAVVYHPFGGGRHQHPGKSTSTSRNAPPGRKVGLIAPKKTGRKRITRGPIEVSS
ncbi:MAG: 50S ribosomal protein L2 [Thaumarchaeota archaeon]|nr:50S ribosomal protein L2 [Nitrososphaerota archaeon]